MTRNVRTLVACLTFYAMTLFAFLIVYGLTPIEERTSLLRWLGTLVPAAVAGTPGILAWLRATDAADAGEATSHALNGQLEQRVTNIMHRVLSERDATKAAAFASATSGNPKDQEVDNDSVTTIVHSPPSGR